MSNLQTGTQDVFNMVLPSSPKIVPQNVDLTTLASAEIDLSQLRSNGFIDFISGVWADNSANSEALIIAVSGSHQKVIFPAGSQGYLPLLAPNDPKFDVSCATAPGLIIPLIFYNVPLLPYLINTAGEPVVISNATWLTDTQLRASPVSVQRAGTGYTDRSIANLSGVSQQLMAANANRHTLVIQNVAANSMGVNLAGGAAAIGTAGTITLPSGASIVLDNSPPTGAITIIGTLNDDVTAYEG